MPLNWIDWLVIAALLFEGYQGWEIGLVSIGASFISFAGSLWLALTFHGSVSHFLSEKFGIAAIWSNVFAYIGVALVAQMVLSAITHILISRIPEKFLKSKYNNWLGVLLSVANGLLLVTFILLAILALPLRGTVKSDIKDSKIGGYLVTMAERYGGSVESTINEVGQQALKFITIDPKSSESLSLDVAPVASDLQTDVTDERIMFNMVNAERIAAGIAPVTEDTALTGGARSHDRDMFMRRYFAHNSPDGQTPADRMHAVGVNFTVAGENIAYAPDVKTAHTGLMNSPEHKRNILDSEFHHLGIGIVSTASYGLMVTQDFTN